MYTSVMDNVWGVSWSFIVLALLATFLFYTLYDYLRLRHIPGPFFASFSNIQRLYWVLSGRAHDHHIALHKKYGPLVRMGPNMVSVGDPSETGKIYGITGKYKKVGEKFHCSLMLGF